MLFQWRYSHYAVLTMDLYIIYIWFSHHATTTNEESQSVSYPLYRDDSDGETTNRILHSFFLMYIIYIFVMIIVTLCSFLLVDKGTELSAARYCFVGYAYLKSIQFCVPSSSPPPIPPHLNFFWQSICFTELHQMTSKTLTRCLTTFRGVTSSHN